MSTTKDEITAALTGRTSGLTTKDLTAATGITAKNAISSTLFSMVARGDVIKHKGDGPNRSRYSLNPDKLTGTPAKARGEKARKKPRRNGAKKNAKRNGKTHSAPPAAERAAGFLPAFTFERELVLVKGPRENPTVQIFSAAETGKVAELLFVHFEVPA